MPCLNARRAGREGRDGQIAVIVSFEHVGLAYDGGPESLENVSFTLHQGEFRFLTGPSGAGKTSFLKLIYLALKPTRGRVMLFGEDVTHAGRGHPRVARRVAPRRRAGPRSQSVHAGRHREAIAVFRRWSPPTTEDERLDLARAWRWDG